MKSHAIKFALWLQNRAPYASGMIELEGEVYETNRSTKSHSWTAGGLDELWDIYESTYNNKASL